MKLARLISSSPKYRKQEGTDDGWEAYESKTRTWVPCGNCVRVVKAAEELYKTQATAREKEVEMADVANKRWEKEGKDFIAELEKEARKASDRDLVEGREKVTKNRYVEPKLKALILDIIDKTEARNKGNS